MRQFDGSMSGNKTESKLRRVELAEDTRAEPSSEVATYHAPPPQAMFCAFVGPPSPT